MVQNGRYWNEREKVIPKKKVRHKYYELEIAGDLKYLRDIKRDSEYSRDSNVDIYKIPYPLYLIQSRALRMETLHNKLYQEQQKPPLRYLLLLTSVSQSDVRPTSFLTKDARLATHSKVLDDKSVTEVFLQQNVSCTASNFVLRGAVASE